jgi:hypothetical protein
MVAHEDHHQVLLLVINKVTVPHEVGILLDLSSRLWDGGAMS